MHTHVPNATDWSTELKFHVPLNTKLVISEMLFAANLLTSIETKPTQHNQCIQKLEYLVLYGRASMGVPVSKLQYGR